MIVFPLPLILAVNGNGYNHEHENGQISPFVVGRALMALPQAAEYTKKARRKKLAQNAMHLLIPDQDGNEFVSPFVPLCLAGKKDKGKQ